MSKNILFFLSIFLIFGIFVLLHQNGEPALNPENVVTEKDGKQEISILARGGYSPYQITAKAGMDTVLNIETKGTYDCSSAMVIPKLNYSTYLPPTGITKVEVPAAQAKGSLEILCSMGMYSSTINFN